MFIRVRVHLASVFYTFGERKARNITNDSEKYSNESKYIQKVAKGIQIDIVFCVLAPPQTALAIARTLP